MNRGRDEEWRERGRKVGRKEQKNKEEKMPWEYQPFH